MKVLANSNDVLTGVHFLDGDCAFAEGGLASGCKFWAGYPITPSTEAAEYFARRCPYVGGIFIQMEDELSALAAVIGASATGTKAMTITSGPGFSLMMEHVGLAAMLEIPLVLGNVQRAGPSTGLPTLPGQADIMQARWGSHGDYEIIALAPNSPQEAFDFAIKAFNLSEKYRVPVLVMMDECVGHMTEKVVIPPAEKIELEIREYYNGEKEKYLPYKPNENLVPPFAKAGDGYYFHMTGLTHDERGYPIMSAECQELCVRRLVEKIRKNSDKIIEIEDEGTDDAEIIIVSYGISSRVSYKSMMDARKNGIKVGMLRLKTIWPFPEKRIFELASKINAYVVVEMNYGQIVYEVHRCAQGLTNVVLVPHGGGSVHNPENILDAIEKALKEKKRNEIIEYYPKVPLIYKRPEVIEYESE